MRTEFFIKIAELNIKISCINPEVKDYCKDYISAPTENPQIEAYTTQEMIDNELARSEEENTPHYVEFLCVYRIIAEQLPKFNCCVFHGAAISFDENGYLFTAQSGTGKSTHICLWRKYLGKAVDIINGDKPILKIADDKILVCSTPWAGKEKWQKNRIYPLAAITFLERSKKSFAEPLTPKDALSLLINQIYMPKNPQAKISTLDIMDKLLTRVPLVRFGCDISEDAVRVAFEALTNKAYEDYKTEK